MLVKAGFRLKDLKRFNVFELLKYFTKEDLLRCNIAVPKVVAANKRRMMDTTLVYSGYENEFQFKDWRKHKDLVIDVHNFGPNRTKKPSLQSLHVQSGVFEAFSEFQNHPSHGTWDDEKHQTFLEKMKEYHENCKDEDCRYCRPKSAVNKISERSPWFSSPGIHSKNARFNDAEAKTGSKETKETKEESKSQYFDHKADSKDGLDDSFDYKFLTI